MIMNLIIQIKLVYKSNKSNPFKHCKLHSYISDWSEVEETLDTNLFSRHQIVKVLIIITHQRLRGTQVTLTNLT